MQRTYSWYAAVLMLSSAAFASSAYADRGISSTAICLFDGSAGSTIEMAFAPGKDESPRLIKYYFVATVF